MKSKFTIPLYCLTTLLIIGWLTSTRHADLQFLIDGQKLEGASFHFLSKSSIKELKLDQNSQVRLPSSTIGKSISYSIIAKNGQELKSGIFLKIKRGKMTVNQIDEKLTISNYHYRFLFYKKSKTTSGFK